MFVAYDILSDPDKRRHYDQYGSNGQKQYHHNQPFDFDSFFSGNNGGNGFFNFNFDDMFNDDVFGDSFGHPMEGKLIQIFLKMDTR